MPAVQELRGILPALATPLDQSGNVDEAGARRLLKYVLEGGVHGVVALGSTGEGATLDEPNRRRIMDITCEECAGRVPVVVGVARTDIGAARAEVQAAAGAGAGAVLVAPPFYVGLDQTGLLTFYRRLAENSPLPVLVYNIPFLTKVSAQPSTLRTLATEGAIAGIKDSSGDFNYHSRVLNLARELPGFRVFTGAETMLLSSLLMGSSGTICGSANVVPGLCVELLREFEAGRLDRARELQFTLLELANAMLTGLLPAGFKGALGILGICQPYTVPPLPALTVEQEQALRATLERHGVMQTSTAGV